MTKLRPASLLLTVTPFSDADTSWALLASVISSVIRRTSGFNVSQPAVSIVSSFTKAEFSDLLAELRSSITAPSKASKSSSFVFFASDNKGFGSRICAKRDFRIALWRYRAFNFARTIKRYFIKGKEEGHSVMCGVTWVGIPSALWKQFNQIVLQQQLSELWMFLMSYQQYFLHFRQQLNRLAMLQKLTRNKGGRYSAVQFKKC